VQKPLGYEAVRDIANTSFGYGNHGVFVVIKSYFDGSGDNESKVVTVGGFSASDDICSKIENEWNNALVEAGYCEPNGAPGIFHLTDFGTKHCKYRTGEWDIKQKRVPLIKRLSSIVNQKGNLIVSFSVEADQFRSFYEDSPNKDIYGPEYFGALAINAFAFVESAIDGLNISQTPAAYVFERGDREHEMHHAFDEYVSIHPELNNLRGLSFEPKILPLLQAADLVSGKISEVLERAKGTLGFLDSGAEMTFVENFERYYSFDGTSQALMVNNDQTAAHFCRVLNKSHLDNGDKRLFPVIWSHPQVLAKRRTHKIWEPK